MSVRELPINTMGNLTGDAKKNLALIIEREFSNKRSLYAVAQQAERDKILEAYRKRVGFDALKKAVERADEGIERAKKKHDQAIQAIQSTGLTEDGEPGQTSFTVYERGELHRRTNHEAVELKKKLDALEANAPSETFKSKLISRLWLATTIGEANEIMREVLGNGVIPKTDIKQITFEG